jgi:hypothetical protein
MGAALGFHPRRLAIQRFSNNLINLDAIKRLNRMVDQRSRQREYDRLVGFDDCEAFLLTMFDERRDAGGRAADDPRDGIGTEQVARHEHRRRVTEEDRLASTPRH